MARRPAGSTMPPPMSDTACCVTGITSSVRSSATAISVKTSMLSAAVFPCQRGRRALVQIIGVVATPSNPSSRRTRLGNHSVSASRLSPRYGIVGGSTAMSPTCRMPSIAGSTAIWFRVPTTFFPQTGTSRGVQTELILTYLVTENIKLGIGGRYWAMWTTSGTQSCHGDCIRGVQLNPALSVYRQHRALRRVRANELPVRHASVVRITLAACAIASGRPRRRRKNRRAPHS